MDNSEQVIQRNPVDELILKGWAFHAEGEQEAAEKSFRTAYEKDANSLEALYGLALVLKSQGRRRDSIKVFEQVIELIENKVMADKVRGTMLRRLAKAHVNELQNGDWNLEAEIWQRKN
jgi:tetratricopeptide (TPR) repeat protein